jgi:hypothetical protein
MQADTVTMQVIWSLAPHGGEHCRRLMCDVPDLWMYSTQYVQVLYVPNETANQWGHKIRRPTVTTLENRVVVLHRNINRILWRTWHEQILELLHSYASRQNMGNLNQARRRKAVGVAGSPWVELWKHLTAWALASNCEGTAAQAQRMTRVAMAYLVPRAADWSLQESMTKSDVWATQ